MRKAWALVAVGGLLLVGPLVAMHWPAMEGLYPGQMVGVAGAAALCHGAIGQLAQAVSRSAGRECTAAGWLAGLARVLEVAGVAVLALGGWRLYGRRVA